MDIRDRINTAMKAAMKEKQADRLSTLRLINAAFKDRDIAARGSDDAPGAASEAELRQILARMAKQRQESVRAYEEGGRLELADRERNEIAVIEEFLPRQLTEEEADRAIAQAIEDTGASSIRDMGKVMGVLKDRHTGQMDFGAAGPEVKRRLS
ncbi:GatB/YqeY domain-containing protein [Palleronia sp. LCG004]|uniref:GatB/YqeY domain-containing protein n=1 Tax=Palleronia sp. LCG004 TaxID=3079304 RepID=UPI002943C3B1|nr:GatB/YqeY domain-containing protein [Palleronia sp. LCG004]WOI57510.1 GatB/YqeY domain-containing protein [Palleronia sp. LCG004]